MRDLIEFVRKVAETSTLEELRKEARTILVDMKDLPELCYTFLPGNAPGKRIGIVKRGESGYYATDFDSETATPDIPEHVVKELNGRLGVSEAQATAMSVGSMFGWHVPGAKPEAHE